MHPPPPGHLHRSSALASLLLFKDKGSDQIFDLDSGSNKTWMQAKRMPGKRRKGGVQGSSGQDLEVRAGVDSQHPLIRG